MHPMFPFINPVKWCIRRVKASRNDGCTYLFMFICLNTTPTPQKVNIFKSDIEFRKLIAIGVKLCFIHLPAHIYVYVFLFRNRLNPCPKSFILLDSKLWIRWELPFYKTFIPVGIPFPIHIRNVICLCTEAEIS